MSTPPSGSPPRVPQSVGAHAPRPSVYRSGRLLVVDRESRTVWAVSRDATGEILIELVASAYEAEPWEGVPEKLRFRSASRP